MAIKHHPDASTLMSYAAGGLPETLAAVVATHADMCAACRAQIRDMEMIGGAVLGTLAPMPVAATAPAVSLRSLEVGTATRPRRKADTSATAATVPAPLARLVGPDLDAIAWKRLGIGLWHKPLAVTKTARGDLRLIKVAPGQAMPEHGHCGNELTLVLAGSYSDATGTYARGDLADLADDVEHQPVAGGVGCICLIAMDDKMQFKSWLARLIQPLTGM